MRVLLSLLTLCLLAGPLRAATDGLDEVNARRARQGLYPFVRDAALTQAAAAAADYRAARRIAGHANDFAFLPAGATSSGAGCGAAEDSWGWLTCFMDDRAHVYAGAAWARGADGQRYMHLFVSQRPNGPLGTVVRGAVKAVEAVTHPVQSVQALQARRTVASPTYYRRGLRRWRR